MSSPAPITPPLTPLTPNTQEKEKRIHIGIINPKGEVNGKETTYFTQEELKG
jgi:hypothetical protein